MSGGESVRAIRSLLMLVKWKVKRRRQNLGALKGLGVPSYISESAKFTYREGVEIGRYCRIGKECTINGEGGVVIGEGTILAPHVVVLSSSHEYDQEDYLPYGMAESLRPVVIGEGVWIGWGALICPGVNIHDGAVVGVGAVVSKDVPSGYVVVGNPAKCVKQRESAKVLQKPLDEERFILKKLYEDNQIKPSRGKMDDSHGIVREWKSNR